MIIGAISAVSAADLNATDDAIALDDTNEEINVIEDSEVLTTNYTPQSFDEIQTVVANANDGDTIILDGYYQFESTIEVKKDLNFVGKNDATVDGLSKVKLFDSSAYDVTFRNITFKNGYATYDTYAGTMYGGAISGWGYAYVDAYNCTFINNFGESGGAIAFCNAFDCLFINNSAYLAGAMHYGEAINCSFINNSASRFGGAIYYVEATNCFFRNNSVTQIYQFGYSGGAMLYGSAVNCTFVENYGVYGSAICHGDAENCSFINNSNSAIYSGNAINCSFINDGGMSDGSAFNCTFNNSASFTTATNCIFVNGDRNGGTFVNCLFANNTDGAAGGTAIDCIFINNTASNGGAMSGGNAINCTFINNTADYGGALYASSAVNCTFERNSAIYGGAAYFGGYDHYGGYAYVANLVNCTFIGNSANYGGSISSHEQQYYSGGDVLKVINITMCRFIDNHALYDGGAIEISHYYRLFDVCDCIFINDTAGVNGGAIFSKKGGNISNSSFINCSSNKGGAMWTESNLVILSSDFTKCTSEDGSNYLGSANPSLYNVTDCIFDVAPKDVTYHYFSTLTVNSLYIAKGDKGMLYANLSNICGPIANKKINFQFNGRKFYSVTNSEGIAEFNINNYLSNFGETSIDLNFAGDELNYPSATNTTVFINKFFGNLSVSLDGEFFNDTYLIFNLIHSKTGVPISDASLQLNFSNGEIINLTTDFEGKAVYLIPFIPDTYDAFAYVTGDYVDVNNVSVSNIVIKKLVGDIEVIPLNDNHTLKIRLFDPDGPDAVYRNVKVNLDVGPKPVVKEELITNEYGYVIFDLLNFTKGTYSISVTVRGDYKDFYDYYLSDFVISHLLNSKVNFSNNITFDFGEYGSTNFTVEGCKIDANNISIVNDTKGLISVNNNTISVFGLSVGNYTLRVETVPDEYHNPIVSYLNIVVNNVKSKIKFSAQIVFDYSSSGSIYATVEGGSIDPNSLTVVGYPKAVIKFGSDNKITVSNLPVGKYNLTVNTIPDGDHMSSSENVSVTVNKAAASIKASKITVAYKKGTAWSIKLVNTKTKKAIANMKVTLKVYTGKKFKTYTVKTNSKGIATFKTSKLAVGTHKVVLSATHAGYVFTPLTSSIKVIKPTPLKFKIQKRTNDGAGSLLSYIVYNKKTGKPINGVKLKVLIYTGKTYKTYTITSKKIKNKKVYNGAVGFSTNNFKAGKHTVKIIPENIKYSGSVKTSITITKAAAKKSKFFRIL